jgi:hypothetical protein
MVIKFIKSKSHDASTMQSLAHEYLTFNFQLTYLPFDRCSIEYLFANITDIEQLNITRGQSYD